MPCRIGCLLAVCAAGMCILSEGTATAVDVAMIGARRDNTLYQDDFGETSNGAGSYFFSGVNGLGEIRRGLVQFDLGVIPPGSTVTGAMLVLHMSRTNTQAPTTVVSLHRVLESWGEGTSNDAANEGSGTQATPGDATWLHRFYDATFWEDGLGEPAPGGVFAPLPSASTLVGGINYYNWNSLQAPGLLADVQSWVNDPANNFGWVLIGDESQPTTAKRFDSRENTAAVNRPLLTVMYTRPLPVCPCDYNHDRLLNSQDFFDFLRDFFQFLPSTDYNGDGLVNSQDYFDFITCFFSLPVGCI